MSSHLKSDAPPVTAILAEFLTGYDLGALPPSVRREGVRSFVNWLGCAVGGAEHDAVSIALATSAEAGSAAELTVPGRREKSDLTGAPLAIGIASHVFDFDDTHLRTIIHPAGPVASALLPLSERHGLHGKDFLAAFILGIEAECRIGNSVYPQHYDIGWHITGTAGVFGAAAACGRVMGLDAKAMTYALGVAATQASGFREMFGSMTKSFHVGAAAKNGLLAAMLAKRGFTSSMRGIEAPRGFSHVMSTARNFAEITEGLGTHWEAATNSYKPFACGIVIHPAIDAAIQVSQETGIPPEEIAAIALSVHPLVLELTGNKAPQVGLQGKFSVYHSTAAGYIRHRAGEEEYSDEAVTDPRIIALRDKITATVDPAIHEDAVVFVMRTRDGRVIEKRIDHCIGSMKQPLSDAQLAAKFTHLVTPVLGAEKTGKLLAAAWAIETKGIRDILALARP